MPPRVKPPSTDSDDDIKPARKPATATKRKAPSADVVTLSDSSDDDVKPAKKKVKVKQPLPSDSDEDGDVKPAKKPVTQPSSSSSSKAKVKASTSKAKGKKRDDDYEDDDQSSDDDVAMKLDADDDEDEDVKPRKKAAASSSSKPKAPVKKPGVKAEAKDDGDDVKPKPKWTFKPKAGPVAPGAPLPSPPSYGALGRLADSRRLFSPRTHTGSKEIPDGDPDCLAGLTIVFTGELASLSREDGQELVKRYGGCVSPSSIALYLLVLFILTAAHADAAPAPARSRVTTAPSSKTSYVVLGAEAGPKKLEQIAKHKIKTLDEDGFLALIGSRKSDPNDPKIVEAKKKEEQKVKDAVKAMKGLGKDAPFVDLFLLGPSLASDSHSSERRD